MGVGEYPRDRRLLSQLAVVYRQIEGMEASTDIHHQQAYEGTRSALEIIANDSVILAHHAYSAAATNAVLVEGDDAITSSSRTIGVVIRSRRSI